jgi:EAL domain-containing protein (putative c-di-GMP-specific phosphodiesterase class I)
MTRLRAHGLRFALDDFGSGFSSYAYLKSLPVDHVKIDGMFVKDILSDSVDEAMVASANQLAHLTGKATIAEFVESTEIAAKLAELGVDYGQGFGLARPVPLE